MKALSRFLPIALASALALPAAAQDAAKPAPATSATAPDALPDSLKSPEAQASYAIGLNVGAGLKHDGIAADPAIITQAISDVLAGRKPLLTEDQTRDVLIRLQASVQAHRAEVAAHAAETNKTEGEAFLKTNAAKAGIVTLPSGLQYEVLTAGTGPRPKADDVVLCNYRGTLLDGTEFDSSYKRGAPDSFPVGGLIKGWTEALQKMPVGSKWRIYVPAALAYGEKGAGPDIGPNAVLVFEIELLSIQAKS